MDSRALLEKLAAVPITQWHYQWEDENLTPRIGPMAQDFKAAFYPGGDDKSITTQEADGMALAAIQGLNQKLEQALKVKDTETEQLKSTLAELRGIVSRPAAKQAIRNSPTLSLHDPPAAPSDAELSPVLVLELMRCRIVILQLLSNFGIRGTRNLNRGGVYPGI